MLFSLKDLASKLSPNTQTKENLHTIKTNAFTLHQFETLSGLVFVINTDPDIPSKSLVHRDDNLMMNYFPTFNCRYALESPAHLLHNIYRLRCAKPFISI